MSLGSRRTNLAEASHDELPNVVGMRWCSFSNDDDNDSVNHKTSILMQSQTIYATTMTGLQSRPIVTDNGLQQQQTFNNTAAAGPKRYQLSFNAENLSNKGGWRRVSSPYVKVEIPTGPKKGEVGETEHVLHSLNPDWAKLFILEFDKTMHVPIEVTVLDWRGDDREPIVMGKASFEATTVFESPGRMQSEVIMGKKGKLYIHIEESCLGPTQPGHVELHIRGLDVKNVEPGPFGLGRSDPVFEIAKKDSDPAIGHSKWNVVYRSEAIMDNLNPFWKPTLIGLEELCYGDLDWPLKITIWDYNLNGKNAHIGKFETSVKGLQERVCVKGNADRDQAILLTVEGKSKTYGLVCVLTAKVVLDAAV